MTTHAMAEAPYAEKLRPQFHFTSTTDWINDPNGLVYFEGEYHLFFQRAPGTNDGNTHIKSWGHAVSTDLVHWKQSEKDALLPDATGSIWSGSAVVDWNNTSGFGIDGKPPLVAFYTRMDEKNSSDQRLAFSTDRGRTWTKFDKPILPHIHGVNRDPKVIWHAPTKRWVMSLYLDRRHHFALFSSADLKTWTKLHDVTLETDDECPDFFPLNVDGDPAKEKWIFTGANGKYVVGSFDGEKFTQETDVLIGDHGNGNFYAAQTWSDAPDGRRIQIAWLRDGKFPGMPFNQQLTFPNELTLRSTSRGPRLFRWPVKEIESLRSGTHAWNDVPLTADNPLANIDGELFDIDTEIVFGTASEVRLNIRGHGVVLRPEGNDASLTSWDRRVAIPSGDGKFRLRVLVDRASIEIFANDGVVALSGNAQIDPQNRKLSIAAKDGEARLRRFTVHGLKSTWGDPNATEPLHPNPPPAHGSRGSNAGGD